MGTGGFLLRSIAVRFVSGCSCAGLDWKVFLTAVYLCYQLWEINRARAFRLYPSCIVGVSTGEATFSLFVSLTVVMLESAFACWWRRNWEERRNFTKKQTKRVCAWIVLLVERLALWWKTMKMIPGVRIHERTWDPDLLVVLSVMNLSFIVFCRWNLEPSLLFLAPVTIKHTLFLIMLFLTTYPDRIFWTAWLLASLQERGWPLLEAVDLGMLYQNYRIVRKYD